MEKKSVSADDLILLLLESENRTQACSLATKETSVEVLNRLAEGENDSETVVNLVSLGASSQYLEPILEEKIKDGEVNYVERLASLRKTPGLTEDEKNQLLEVCLQDGDIEGAERMTRLLGRGLSASELEQIITSSIQLGRWPSAERAKELLPGRKFSQEELDKLAEKLSSTEMIGYLEKVTQDGADPKWWVMALIKRENLLSRASREIRQYRERLRDEDLVEAIKACLEANRWLEATAIAESLGKPHPIVREIALSIPAHALFAIKTILPFLDTESKKEAMVKAIAYGQRGLAELIATSRPEKPALQEEEIVDLIKTGIRLSSANLCQQAANHRIPPGLYVDEAEQLIKALRKK